MTLIIGETTLRKCKRAFRQQIFNAAKRGIEMRLTFEEWLHIWVNSGHLRQRGCRQGQYVMARHGDKGHYELGNVSIVSVAKNNIDGLVAKDFNRESVSATMRGKPKTAEHRRKLVEHLRLLGKNRRGKPGRKQSIEERKKRSESVKAVKARIPFLEKSRAARKAWDTRRENGNINKGHPQSAETRAVISVKLLQHFAQRRKLEWECQHEQ